jgi:hypothetical protein
LLEMTFLDKIRSSAWMRVEIVLISILSGGPKVS